VKRGPNVDRIHFELVDLTGLFKEIIDADEIGQKAMCTALAEPTLFALVLLQTVKKPRRTSLSAP
jgi:hypothetical protein